MKKELEIYFHLGLTKVASTYYQSVIFPNLSGISFYPKHQFKKYKEIVVNGEGGKHLFSIEKDKRLVQTLEEIISFFPDAKIILFIRRHDDWIISRYKYHIKKHGGLSFNEFFDIESDQGLWSRESLFLQKKIEDIERLCKKPPLILTYDDIKKKPDMINNRLTQFMGVSLDLPIRRNRKVNKAFNEKQLILLRKFNRIFPYRQAKTANRTLNKTHRKYREFVLHILAFIVRIIPRFFFAGRSLFTSENRKDFERIRSYYKRDWDFCKQYQL